MLEFILSDLKFKSLFLASPEYQRLQFVKKATMATKHSTKCSHIIKSKPFAKYAATSASLAK